jgi:uncharacterized surface protein with fasciclin (FAS1) repeats
MSDRSNIIDTFAKQDMFSTFTRLMKASNANEIFKGEGSFTVFAPTNDAFAKIPEATLNELMNEADQTKLRALLSYHILPGKVMAANLISASTRKAFTGEELMFTDVNGLKVNGASIQARNLEATNGVVHALDTVLTPTRSAAVATAATTASSAPKATGSPSLTAVPPTPARSDDATTSKASRDDSKPIL